MMAFESNLKLVWPFNLLFWIFLISLPNIFKLNQKLRYCEPIKIYATVTNIDCNDDIMQIKDTKF